MTSQALYRKWRSQTFGELVGQEHVVQTLRNAIRTDRLGHAYLFTGPRGVGKTTVARLLAKAVNCEAPVEQRPCDQCEPCRSIAEGSAVDVIEMDAASHTGVDDAREIIERVQFRPTAFRTKVYVIDECFRYEDLVTLADGTKQPIGKLVESEWQGEVLSYNELTGIIEPKPIIRHMRKQPVAPTVRIRFDNNRTIVCTINHKFYTPAGQICAGHLQPGNFVYTHRERITRHQRAVISGAAIGDGHLDLTGSKMRARLQLVHSISQKDYLEYKVKLLGDLVRTPPRYSDGAGTYSKTGTYHCTTLSRPEIAEIHRALYQDDGRKRITRSYLDRIDDLGLALWYLDDGSLVTTKHPHTRVDGSITEYPATRSTFSTHGFTPDEAYTICQWLQETWDIEGRVSVTARGPVVWLTLAGTRRLHSIIARHVPDSMAYKLLPQFREQFQPLEDDITSSGLAVSVIRSIEPVEAPDFVYNIEVADNHNYFVRDILVANCHMLTVAAFNALLKTLEEPPPHVLFILATTEFHKVPATIVSRCQRFVFTRHSVRDITNHLLQVAEAESISLEPAAAEMIARAATGAMRDALSVLDQLIAGSDGTVTLYDVQGLLGAAESSEVLRLITALADDDMPGALQVIAEVADGGADLRQFARDLVERVRGVMLLAAARDATTLDLPEETLNDMQALADRIEMSRLVEWLKLLSNLDFQLKNSPYGQLPLELAVVELLMAPQHPVPAQQARAAAPARPRTTAPQPEPVRQRQAPDPGPMQPDPVQASPPVASDGAPPVAATPPAEDAPEPTTTTDDTPKSPAPAQPGAGQVNVIQVEDNAAFLLEEVEGLWPQFVEDVRAEDRLVYAQLEGISPINIDEQTIVLLATKGKWQKSMLEKERTLRLIERMLTKALHATAHIRITTDEQEEMPDTRKQIQHARNDPLVRKAINIFEAEIIGIDTP